MAYSKQNGTVVSRLVARIRPLWADSRPTGEAEPSEARFRAWALSLGAVLVPAALLYTYYRLMFPGLVNPDALDYAQLGRNLAAGRGFMTDILRPLALSHGGNPLQQPDVTHGPLFPFLLALAFGVARPTDGVAAMVSGVFYLLTIPVVYRLGRRLFDRSVALFAALIVIFNALMLEYAISGLPITLYVFLTTWLLLVVYEVFRAYNLPPPAPAGLSPGPSSAGEAGSTRAPSFGQTARAAASQTGDGGLTRGGGRYAVAGLLLGLLYLTDPTFIWLVPAVALPLILMRPDRKAIVGMALPFCLLVLPWMARNFMLTGDPIFGLRGAEIWMGTKGHYPGYLAYRLLPGEMAPGVSLFKSVVDKLLLSAGIVIQAFPQVTASWVLAFLLPCLLFRFSSPPINFVRKVMMYCFLGILAGLLAFHIQMPMFVAVVPAMLVFSVAYLFHLVQQAQLRGSALGLVTGLLGAAVVFPLLSAMFLNDRPPRLKERTAATALAKETSADQVILSDQPWLVAWAADRPSMWIPAEDSRVKALRDRFPTTKWLFLTDGVMSQADDGYSPAWKYLYQVFARWNMGYDQAVAQKKSLGALRIRGQGIPLMEALDGFTVVPPGKDSSPSVVVATSATGPQQVGAR